MDDRQTVVSLPNAALLALRARHREGAMVTCTSGTCWVTEEGVFQDFILKRGDAYRARKGGLVVVCALSDSVLSMKGVEARPRASAASVLASTHRARRIARGSWRSRDPGPPRDDALPPQDAAKSTRTCNQLRP